MLKKLLLVAACGLASVNASAAYIQYTLSGDVTGTFVQNLDDKSIADFRLNVPSSNFSQFFPSGPLANISAQGSDFWGVTGPTNFAVYNAISEVYITRLRFDFDPVSQDGTYGFSAFYSQVQDPGYPSGPGIFPLHPYSTWLHGSAAGTVLTADQAAYYLQGYPDGIQHVIPTQNVPEPASIALFAIGALGAASVVRRRKSGS
jgi:hypothetical protein